MLLMALLQAIYLTGCSSGSSEGCEPYSVKHFYLTDYQKSRCPYTGDEQLLFISNKGDSILFKGQGKKIEFYKEHFGSPDCDGRDEKYENIRFTYLSGSGAIRQFEVFLNNRSAQSASGLIIYINNLSVGYSPSFKFIDTSGYSTYMINGKQILAREISTIANPDSTYYNHTQGLIRYVQNDTLSWNIYQQ